jgi:hypothetical protein
MPGKLTRLLLKESPQAIKFFCSLSFAIMIANKFQIPTNVWCITMCQTSAIQTQLFFGNRYLRNVP